MRGVKVRVEVKVRVRFKVRVRVRVGVRVRVVEAVRPRLPDGSARVIHIELGD